MKSLLSTSRLRLCGAACRDPPHSFFRASFFGLVENEDVSKRPRNTPTHQGQIKDAVAQFGASRRPSERSLDPRLLEVAQLGFAWRESGARPSHTACLAPLRHPRVW